MKTCLDCAEEVQDEARVCRYCGFRFDTGESATGAQSPPASSPQPVYPAGTPVGRRSAAPIVLAALALIAAGIGAWYLLTGDERQEGRDADAKATARLAQTAMETYAIDHGGSYEGATAETLHAIEPVLPDDLEVTAGADTFTVTVPSDSGSSFTVARESGGFSSFTCEPPGEGECPLSGEWEPIRVVP